MSFGTDVRTIRRDIKDLRERGIVVPTRGQQKDIGPGVTHREIAIKMFIEHKEPLEIARSIMHSIRLLNVISTHFVVLFMAIHSLNAI